MDADLDLLLIAVYCTVDDLLPKKPENARRRISDAEVYTLRLRRRCDRAALSASAFTGLAPVGSSTPGSSPQRRLPYMEPSPAGNCSASARFARRRATALSSWHRQTLASALGVVGRFTGQTWR